MTDTTRRWARTGVACAAAVALMTGCDAGGSPGGGGAAGGPHQQRSAISPIVYQIDPGIEVARYDGAATDAVLPPVVLVHGGGGDWRTWAWMAQRISESGRVVYAFSWLHHGNSARLPDEVFTRRSILDVARVEIPAVTRHALELTGDQGHERVDLVGRSMGGAASLAFAATNPEAVRRLAVLQPVVPAQFAPDVIPLDIEPFAPSDPGDAAAQHDLFYPTLDEDLAFGLYLGSNPESPLAIHEATRWTLDIDVDAIRAESVLAVGSDPALDLITPPASIRDLAEHMGARYEQLAGAGHSDVMVADPHRGRLRDLLTEFLRQGA